MAVSTSVPPRTSDSISGTVATSSDALQNATTPNSTELTNRRCLMSADRLGCWIDRGDAKSSFNARSSVLMQFLVWRCWWERERKGNSAWKCGPDYLVGVLNNTMYFVSIVGVTTEAHAWGPSTWLQSRHESRWWLLGDRGHLSARIRRGWYSKPSNTTSFYWRLVFVWTKCDS